MQTNRMTNTYLGHSRSNTSRTHASNKEHDMRSFSASSLCSEQQTLQKLSPPSFLLTVFSFFASLHNRARASSLLDTESLSRGTPSRWAIVFDDDSIACIMSGRVSAKMGGSTRGLPWGLVLWTGKSGCLMARTRSGRISAKMRCSSDDSAGGCKWRVCPKFCIVRGGTRVQKWVGG